MNYVVNGAWIEMGPLISPEHISQLLEQVVIPSLQMFAQWEAEGKISGGVFPGERETTFVMKAESPEEVGTLLTSLPFWGFMKWNVRTVQSFPSSVQREVAGLQMIRANLSQAQR